MAESDRDEEMSRTCKRREESVPQEAEEPPVTQAKPTFHWPPWREASLVLAAAPFTLPPPPLIPPSSPQPSPLPSGAPNSAPPAGSLPRPQAAGPPSLPLQLVAEEAVAGPQVEVAPVPGAGTGTAVPEEKLKRPALEVLKRELNGEKKRRELEQQPVKDLRRKQLLQERERLLSLSRDDPERLYRVRQTVLQMLADRNYLLFIAHATKASIARCFQDFLCVFGSRPSRDRLGMKAYHATSRSIRLGVFFAGRDLPMNLYNLKAWEVSMKAQKMERGIVITEDRKETVHPQAVEKCIQVFAEDDLLINFKDLEKPHAVLMYGDVEEFKSKYPHIRHHRDMRNQMSDTSPLAKYYGLCRGCMIRLIPEHLTLREMLFYTPKFEDYYVVVPAEEMSAAEAAKQPLEPEAAKPLRQTP